MAEGRGQISKTMRNDKYLFFTFITFCLLHTVITIKDLDAAHIRSPVAVIGGALVCMVLLSAVLLLFCTDCYNAEVHSTDHPACRSKPSSTHPLSDTNCQILSSAMRQQNYSLPYELPPSAPEENFTQQQMFDARSYGAMRSFNIREHEPPPPPYDDVTR